MVRAPGTDERGQLLLVGAIGIALVVVGTVVLVNGLAFDDSISTRSNQDALSGAERTVGMIEADLNTLAREVRADVEDGGGDFTEAFRENVSLYSRHYTNLSFDNGIVYTNVRFNATETDKGVVLNQTESMDACSPRGRPLFRVQPDCDADATLLQDVSAIQDFRITVEDIPNGNAKTELVVDGDGGTWTLEIDGRRGREEVNISGGGIAASGSPYGEGVVIELRPDGQIAVDGQPEFEFAEGVDPPYEISLNNGDGPGFGSSLAGTYLISSDGSYPHDPDEDQPEVKRPTLFPAVDIYYQRRDVVYNRTIVLNETGAR
ncbi:DUF7261 family protein [Halorientalis regularis]|uniref:Uncharacterized protein n=1 Tax=Halorientalis regularis TaxID=660518 RepID=A0A1G7F3U5_9EURY|nr:hypothetical protein [Halorientalis regularis]SDE70416.1 hypothetical protein SAMN05216218_1018 [Halorientalis regularis]